MLIGADPGISDCSAPILCSTRTPAHSTTSCGSLAARCSEFTSMPPHRAKSRPMSCGQALTTVAFGCADRAELEQWETRLNSLGIAHGGVIDAHYGSGLSFRDPDNIALEFFAPPG